MAKTRKASKPPRLPTHASPSTIRHQSYMNVTQTWKDGVGRRNTVMIRNGTGVKRVERLGPNGSVVSSKTRKLTAPERSQILRGQFIPGLWANCRIHGTC